MDTSPTTTDDTPVTPPSSASTAVTSTPVPITPDPVPHQLLAAEMDEQLRTVYHVHELPSLEPLDPQETLDSQHQLPDSGSRTILQARIEVLEAENAQLKVQATEKLFRNEDIQHDDKLVRFYTGFVSYMMFLAFSEFLGPAVERLQYWGSKESEDRQRAHSRKLGPKNELFLTLVKLKLNLPNIDLAVWFGISVTQVSCYVTTWICFMCQHFKKEIDWMPAVEQVFATQPYAFRDKFPTTYAIIDASEVFMETPSDLHLQSSTWSQYKHHNTVKF